LKWKNKKRRRKMAAIMLAWLMVFSSFASPLANAAEEKQKSFSAEELVIEKQREQEYQSEKPAHSEQKPAAESGDLPNLLKGLGIEAPPLDENSSQNEPEGKADAVLQNALEKEKEIDVIIRMKDKPDLNQIYPQVKANKNRAEKNKTIQQHLKDQTNISQKGIQQALSALESKGKAKKKESLWIINGITATITKDALEELKKRDDIADISLDETVSLPEVTVDETPPRLPQWGLEKIYAPKVWGQYGLKGEGIVVGIMDSGVDGNHEALKHNYRGRNGNHQYSWIDLSGQNYETPNDGFGHGTHVAGTAVGGGAGEPIGVAPEAEWIAAKIFNDGGSTTLSAIHQAFQWFMAPGGDPSKAPHIVNNSWGNSNAYNLEFYEDVKAWVAAGIFPSFAAGNDGPGSQTIGSPGSFPESFAVGATDVYDQTASFSSRGPVFWEDENGQQKRIIKPDISAPGHRIYSAWPSKRNEGKYNTISGTSMATPHVTGAIALLYQANPDLSIDEIKETLIQTVRVEPHMGALPNDSYGSGIINIYQAITETAFAGELKGTLSDKDGNPVEGKLEIKSEGLTYAIGNDGTFSFKIREGTHKITISSFGYENFETTVDLKKGEALSVKWVLHTAQAFSVKGKVIDESGGAIPYAYVRVKGTPLSTIRSNEEGVFDINRLPSGKYMLQVSGEGITGFSKEVEVTTNTSIELKVEKKASLFTKQWGMANGNIHRNAVSANGIDLGALEKGWEYDTASKGQILFSTPAAAENKIVLVTDSGYAVALDSTTGKEIWAVKIGRTNRSSPTIAGENVYLSGGEDGSIYSLDLKSGSINWSTQIGTLTIYESPLYLDGTLFVASDLTNDAKLVALNAQTGAKKWSVPLGAPTYFGPSAGEGLLFIGSYDNQKLRAINTEDGSEVWSKTLVNEGIASKPVYHEGTLFIAGTNFNTDGGSLYALDAKTGEEKWQASGIGDTQAGSPIVYENIVVIGSATQPVLRAFDRNNGKEIWNNRSVGTTLNSGSVSANGLLFYTGTSGTLSIVDVYTGERLKDFSLPVYSTSGIPLLPGQVIVPYQTGIQSYQSHGVIKGTLKDEHGKPVSGTVTVVETGESVTAGDDGSYMLKHTPGENTIKASLYGKKQIKEEIHFVSGYEHTRNYQLQGADTGSISITVNDKRSGKSVEGVGIKINNTSVEGKTDSKGIFAKEDVFEGTFDVTFTLNGYKEGHGVITVNPGEKAESTFELQPIDIAVLNDYKGEITSLMNVNGYIAEERGWDVINDIGRYKVLYLNGAYGSDGVKPTEEEFKNLLKRAEENEISLIFTDQWGAGYGSIHHLKDFLQNPKELGHDYDGGEVKVQVEEPHPILKGYKAGDQVSVLEHNADFAWFNQYTGRTIAKIGNSELGFVGSGIAYNAVSEDSAHLLLSSHSSVPWESSKAWLRGQQQILMNSLDYLYTAKFGKISGTVVNSSGEPVEAGIEVLETGVTTTTDINGKFEIYHDEGSYKLEVRSKGLGAKTVDVTTAKGTPAALEISLGESLKGSLSGQITDAVSGMELEDVKVTVKSDAGEMVSETQSGTNGRYALSGLDEEVYQLTFSKDRYIVHTEKIDLARHEGDVDIQLHTMPSVAVVGDYFSTDKNFKALLNGIGVKAVDVQPGDLAKRMAEFDVVFFNEPSNSALTKAIFDEMLMAADAAETSLIFGDAYWSGSGINHLVRHRQDPKERNTIRNTTASAQYKIIEEHPIFNNAKTGDAVEILASGYSSIGFFKNYSGYPLAEIKHAGSDVSHGLGVAYKPRTAGSVELLMSGHGFASYHGAKDYTDQGKQILINSILWAADVKFPVISGTILDEKGKPLQADVKVKDQPFASRSSSEDGSFSIAILSGEYEIEISAYGFQTKTLKVRAESAGDPQSITMEVADNVGSIIGTVENEKDGNSIEDATVTLLGKPRETATNLQGQYNLDKIEPGEYTVRIQKDGFVRKDVIIKITEGEKASINTKLRPSPTIGVIVDLTASGTTFKQYLEERGYKVTYMNYKEIDKLDEVDLVFANSDYQPSLVPTKDEFLAFQKALDEKRISVIWTGQAGGRGSIRYLQEFMNDPKTIFEDNNEPGAQGTVLGEHPLTKGFEKDETIEIPGKSGYYYGFDGYSGKTIVDFSHTKTGEKGSMVAYKGRTTETVEILLANMVISHVFKPNESFDQAREVLLNNALTWALDEKAALTGELHGSIKNENGSVQGEVTIKETGKTYQTDSNGSFFAALEEGTYTITVDAFGHATKDFTLMIKNGQEVKESFVIQSIDSGTLTGKIMDGTTKEPVAGASVEILGTPATAKTNEQGKYLITLPAGSYDVRIMAPGYTPIYETADIVTGQETSLNISLEVSDKIAVLANPYNETRIVPFLQGNGYELDFYPYTDFERLIENIPNYKLIIVNDTSISMKDRFKAMVDKANEHGVSLIFPSMFGFGTIGDLSSAYGDPETVSTGYVDKQIKIRVDENHPIFRGFNKGDELSLLENAKGSVQYSIFKNYGGTTVGSLTNDVKGDLGSSIGYKFSSSNSVHILLSALHIGSYGNPNDRWTENAKSIYLNAIDFALTASQGEIKGEVKDEQGKPIPGALVSIQGTSMKTTTNASGTYRFGIGVGEYEVKIQARGFAEQTKQVSVAELGSIAELHFTLKAIDGTDLSGVIINKKGEMAVSEAALTLIPKEEPDFKMEATSDEKGSYKFENLLPGSYKLKVEAAGYLPETFEFEIDDKDMELNLELNAYEVAVIGDINESLATFLNEQQIFAEEKKWDILGNTEKYKVILVNTGKGTKEQYQQLIKESDENKVSLVFTGTWGVNEGSIQNLKEVLGNPEMDQQGYNQGAVFVKAVKEHPMFEGISANENGEVKIHAERSPFATFKGYTGIPVADLTVDGEILGSSMAYEFRSKDHMHLLLSSFAVTNIIGPEYGWTKEGKQLFTNALRWSMVAEQQVPAAPAWDLEEQMVKAETAILTGKAELGTTINVYEDHGNKRTLLGNVKTNLDGTYSIELDLDNGTHTLIAEANNFAGKIEAKRAMKLIVTGKPQKKEKAS
jgi:subtilisin family serine protease/outer membrane protein assembly factor BamB